MLKSLINLKTHHGVSGIKTEFEAEGATFREVMAQRIWTLKAGLPLHLKIGGVEAIRDLKDARDLEVDGIIAPMVESPFALKKFYSAVDRIFPQAGPKLYINLETISGYHNMEEIFTLAKERIHGVTIGRTDFCGSLMNGITDPNHKDILELVDEMVKVLTQKEIRVTLGGTLTKETLALFKTRPHWMDAVAQVETRKIIFDTNWLVDHPESLKAGLQFEQDFLNHAEAEGEEEREFRKKRREALSRRV